MTVIKDGTGTSQLAKVDNENRLHTSTVTIPESAHVSIHEGETFSIIGTTTITNVEKTIILLINNTASEDTIAIESLRIGLQGESGKPATFKLYLGRRTYTSGGTVITPVNLNAASVNSLDVAAIQDNPTIGGSDSQVQQAFLETTTTFDTEFNGEIILHPSASIRITVTGDSTASGTKTALSRILYFAINMSLQ